MRWLPAVSESRPSRTGAFRLYEFLTRTLVPVFIAGCIATGCSTCAPKYASSAASSNDTSGTGFASGHTRGSAVRMPSTSFPEQ